MQSTTYIPVSLARVRVWLVAAIVLLAGPAVLAQTPLPAYYSTGSNLFQITQPSPQISGSGHISAGINAADGDLATYATLQADATASLGVPVGLRLKLTNEAPAGYRAGVLLANATSLLTLQAIGTVTLRTYLAGVFREEKVVRADLVRAAILATNRPTQLEFLSSKSFDEVEIEIGGLVGVFYTTNIYYAYGVRPGIQTIASGYLSRFSAPASTDYGTANSSGVLCVATDVDNPERVADGDLTNYASFKSVLTVACPPALRTKLAGVPLTGVPAGHYAGFLIGQAGLLDVGVLSGLRVNTYRNGTLVQSFTGPSTLGFTGASLLELTLLPGNKALLAFPTTSAFDEVGIERTGLITAVDNLQIYYGFGLAPAAFQGINPVLSDFTVPNTTTADYSASASQGGLIDVTTTIPNPLGGPPITTTVQVAINLSNVDNPQFAADANTTNYAQLNTTGLGLLGNAKATLRLRLNGHGHAGNRVGMVINTGAGLLDLAALKRLTLLTYDVNGTLIETKTGSDLLSVSLLSGSTNRDKVSFLATRDFEYVELEVNSAASVLSNTRVYYAFAEDVTLLSLQFPLPVELTTFTGRWANGAAELNWATATEKNSSYFMVERSTGSEAGFVAVGQVAAAGTSTSPKNYQLRDAEAGAQGVALMYYRLRQVDLDGKESFSPLVSVAVGKAGIAASQIQVYPNPALDAQPVQVRLLNLQTAGATVQTYSQMGQLISRQPVAEAATQLVLPKLASGLYHVVLRDANGQKMATQRLVVGGR